jgi:hypothetical protein
VLHTAISPGDSSLGPNGDVCCASAMIGQAASPAAAKMNIRFIRYPFKFSLEEPT